LLISGSWVRAPDGAPKTPCCICMVLYYYFSYIPHYFAAAEFKPSSFLDNGVNDCTEIFVEKF
ncbi:hypothetical protein OCV67_01580, partial [Porcipelethomonas ammoniilytica]|uniref:hypothetical protein n=1 Tax=Porcipelethomonas ammoniilytica TaxID=2981722 RepID=UPI0021D25CDA